MRELYDEFSFEVPNARFNPKVVAKVWDGCIHMVNLREQTIYRGLIPKIVEFCESRGYEIEFDGDFNDYECSVKEVKDFIETLNLPDWVEIREYQIDAIVHCIRAGRLLCLSPTSSGKSLIIYILFRWFSDKTLLIVPTTHLVRQMASDFESYGYSEEYHLVTAGVSKNSEVVTIVSDEGTEYKFQGNENIKLLNSNVYKLAKDLKEIDEIDDRWLQKYYTK